MSELRSSQRQELPRRDSSVTQVRRSELALGSSSVSAGNDQATVISSRPSGSSSDAPPLLPPLEVGRLLEGEQLGQFELRQFVGGGGMGVVFRGWDKTLNREVAVKVLARDQSSDEETVRRFHNEAQSAARLDHPNIARVYGMGEDRGVHYIIFEFIEGVNLRDLVDRHGPLPLDEALDYTLQLAEALDHASQRDVIHRDIKPSNVLITAEGNAKLVDMGLARLHQVEHTNGDLTASGVTLGTFDYISPEQARDPRSADVRSDLYSLGCSLYFMLVGQPPFPNGTVLQKLLQHQGDAPPDLRHRRDDLPPELVRLVSRLLAKSPAQRYQSPAALIRDLSTIRKRLYKQPGRAGLDGWRVRRPRIPASVRKHLPWAIPLVLLILASLALDFYWTLADRTEKILPVKTGLTPIETLSGTADRFGKRAKQDTPADTVPGATPEKTVAPPPTPEDDNSAANVAPSVPNDPPTRESKAPVEPVVDIRQDNPKGVLTVGSAATGATHGTLSEAIRAAESGDVIELCYSGTQASVPFQVNGKSLTIRAADGYLPGVRFTPSDATSTDSPRAMIVVQDGNVSLANVGIEWGSRAAAPQGAWNLFALKSEGSLQLEKCAITFRKPVTLTDAMRDAAIIIADASRPGQPADGIGIEGATPAAQPFGISMQNCLIRGDAKLLSIAEGTSARIVCDNALLILAGQVLDVTAPSSGGPLARVEFEARHLTLDAGRGLLTVNLSLESRANLAVDLRVVDSILRVAPGSALIEQRGFHASEDGAAGISWNGDRNFYEGMDTFWRQGGDRTTGNRLSFADWQAYWGPARESNSHVDRAIWDAPPPQGQRASDAVPADYTLSTSAVDNPALGSASDGQDAGCQLEFLPSVR